MFLSIIIPIYNDEEYLEECLDSCLNQDIPYSDYEIICVDDGSTDSTPEILMRYQHLYPNIKVIFKDHGVRSGRNIGLESAEGDYVWFVDHDDFIEENILGNIRREVGRSNCDRLIVSAYRFFENLTDEEREKRADGTLADNHSRYADNVIWQSIVKRSFLKAHQISPRAKELERRPAIATDTFFVYELWRNNASEHVLKTSPIYFYRVNHNSESLQLPDYERQVYGFINVACVAKKEYESEKTMYGQASERTAIGYVRWVRQCGSSIALMPSKYFHMGRKIMRAEHLIPMNFPSECTFRYFDWIHSKSGENFIKKSLHFFTYKPVGMAAYRVANIKPLLYRVANTIKRLEYKRQSK